MRRPPFLWCSLCQSNCSIIVSGKWELRGLRAGFTGKLGWQGRSTIKSAVKKTTSLFFSFWNCSSCKGQASICTFSESCISLFYRFLFIFYFCLFNFGITWKICCDQCFLCTELQSLLSFNQSLAQLCSGCALHKLKQEKLKLKEKWLI